MDLEPTFAAEAQDEALLSRIRTPDRVDGQDDFGVAASERIQPEDEASPLIAGRGKNGERITHRWASDHEYQAPPEGNEPHTSIQLPWYKKPSVMRTVPRGPGMTK